MSRSGHHSADDRRAMNDGGAPRQPISYSSSSSPPPPPFHSSSQSSRPMSGTYGHHPAAHPDSAFNRLRAQRNSGIEQGQVYEPSSSDVHRQGQSQGQYHNNGRGLDHSHSTRTTSTATPGADNMGATSAGGGIAGVAVGVANSNDRTSGADAVRGYRYETAEGMYNNGHAEPTPYADHPTNNPYAPSLNEVDERYYDSHDGHSTDVPRGPPPEGIGAGAFPAAAAADRDVPAAYAQPNMYRGGSEYYDDPYRRQHALAAPGNPESINPDSIVDDGDDGLTHDSPRRSFLALGRDSSRNNLTAGAAGGAAATGGVAAAMSNQPDGPTHPGPDGGPSYDALQPEKSEWLDKQTGRRKKMKWIIGLLVAFLVIGGIVGGVVGGILSKRKSDGSSGSSGSSGSAKPGDEIQSAEEDLKVNGDLDKDSEQIKALMDNEDLHKVFPGVDYTPWGTQYPDCLTYPPSQNNITRDMAVLSQMTNVVRLYGNDCNQTQMVLHAIDRLELSDMKLWLGVWIDNDNTTTNDRQLENLHDILDSTDDLTIFKGVIVGNEVLYRGHQTTQTLNTLSDYIEDVKSELSDKDIDLPVATSDLGDAWTEGLAKIADVVMANIHPFFGGVTIDNAAAWTYTFWESNNLELAPNKPHIVAEVGWPTGGGNNCSPKDQCPDDTSGAVAGIEELNQFMEDWVCQALENGTDYFWFEAFDEPWKEQFNEPSKGKEWEDKWGLMYPDRTLKPGVSIPDCGGSTAE